MNRLLRVLPLALLAACSKKESETSAPAPAAQALYRVTFEGTWSAATHPGLYPAGAHFSALIGASHRADDPESRLFRAGTLASPGIKNMAELGNNTALRAEINALIGQGKAFRLFDGRAGFASPGTYADTLRLDAAHPAATLVTMVAPSPDWFAALSAENLLSEGDWAQHRRVPAHFYDAGTDSGPAFTSPDQPTVPAEPIRAAWADQAPVGYFHLERIK